MNDCIFSSMRKVSSANNLFIYLLAIIIACFVYHYLSPGFISFDALEQYKQADGLIAVYTAHPVIMTYLWRALIKATGKPEIIFFVFQLGYWTVVAISANVLTNKLSKKIMILFLVGFWPPAFLLSLNVWKDVIMMSALSLSAISIYAYSISYKKTWFILCLFSLFVATSVRINGFIPSIIIATGVFFIYFSQVNKTIYKNILKSVTCSLLFILLCFALISVINIKAEKTYDLGTLAVWDIANISIMENKNLIPNYLHDHNDDEKTIEYLKQYNSREANFPVYSYISPYPPLESQPSLKYDWLNTIIENPTSYLKHRWHVFSILSGKYVNGHTYYPFHPGIQGNEYGFYFYNINTDTASTLIGFFSLLADTISFKVYIYYIISILIIFICAYRIHERNQNIDRYIVILFICLSGLISNASLFFLATAADFRYSIWQILSVIFAFLFLLSKKNSC